LVVHAAVQVRIWDANFAPLDVINAHQEACRAVAVAPTDQKFATCSDDKSVKVWDLKTRKNPETTLTGAPSIACCVASVGFG
jgi:polyadenylation factor subunit 2